MALDTYANIKTAAGTWLARDDLTSYLPDLMTAAEYRIYREVKVRQMETQFSSAISSGTVSVPSGFLEWKVAYVDGSPVTKLEPSDTAYIYRAYPTRGADGKPRYIAREGSSFVFGPYPDSNYTIKGVYYKQLTALSDSNTTNWLTTDAPDLLLWATLAEAAPFLKDDARIMVWEGKYQAAKQALLRQDRRDMGPGLAMKAG
jgi:hypothetical protein